MHVCYYQSRWILWYLKEQGSLCHFINMISWQRLNSSPQLPPWCKNNSIFLKLIWKENGSWTSYHWLRVWVAFSAPDFQSSSLEIQVGKKLCWPYYSGILQDIGIPNTVDITDCNSMPFLFSFFSSFSLSEIKCLIEHFKWWISSPEVYLKPK